MNAARAHASGRDTSSADTEPVGTLQHLHCHASEVAAVVSALGSIPVGWIRAR
jgi:hypothetical protein